MKERRLEQRLLCADLVELEWVDAKGKRRRAVANLEDISAAGACLQVETPIPLNTEIAVHLPDDTFRGTIRYCVHREIGYYLGIEFAEGTRWSAQTYRPQHLFDPQKLIPRGNKPAKTV
jgi:hypothetical protein